MTALGAALYHDHLIADDPRPAEALLDALLPNGGDGLQQFCVPLAPRKETPSRLRREALFARVKNGELVSFLVATPAATADTDALTIGFTLAPTTAAAQEGRAGYRYRVDVALGANVVARSGAATIVDALVAFANGVPLRAGVVFPAESASFAHAYASGTRGGLSEEQDRLVKDVFYAVYELGDRIRGPEWGTFLGPHHVAALGGRERIEREAGCAVIRRLEAGGLYLQASERPDDAHTLNALAAFLAPVR